MSAPHPRGCSLRVHGAYSVEAGRPRTRGDAPEQLAQGILREQDQHLPVPDRASKVQQLTDTVLLHAHRLQHDPMVRAGVRLSLDREAQEVNRQGAFTHWGTVIRELLEQAEAQGELLPHIHVAQTADVLVGSFAGVQAMSQVLSDYQDILTRVTALLHHILPSTVLPPILATTEITPARAPGRRPRTASGQHTPPPRARRLGLVRPVTVPGRWCRARRGR